MQWISVKEKLPHFGEDVWIHSKLVGVMLGYRSSTNPGYYLVESYWVHENQVTHWIPLVRPEPPKDVE